MHPGVRKETGTFQSTMLALLIVKVSGVVLIEDSTPRHVFLCTTLAAGDALLWEGTTCRGRVLAPVIVAVKFHGWHYTSHCRHHYRNICRGSKLKKLFLPLLALSLVAAGCGTTDVHHAQEPAPSDTQEQIGKSLKPTLPAAATPTPAPTPTEKGYAVIGEPAEQGGVQMKPSTVPPNHQPSP